MRYPLDKNNPDEKETYEAMVDGALSAAGATSIRERRNKHDDVAKVVASYLSVVNSDVKGAIGRAFHDTETRGAYGPHGCLFRLMLEIPASLTCSTLVCRVQCRKSEGALPQQ